MLYINVVYGSVTIRSHASITAEQLHAAGSIASTLYITSLTPFPDSSNEEEAEEVEDVNLAGERTVLPAKLPGNRKCAVCQGFVTYSAKDGEWYHTDGVLALAMHEAVPAD